MTSLRHFTGTISLSSISCRVFPYLLAGCFSDGSYWRDIKTWHARNRHQEAGQKLQIVFPYGQELKIFTDGNFAFWRLGIELRSGGIKTYIQILHSFIH